VLDGHNSVEYLAKPQDGIDCYGRIVDLDFVVGECLPQEIIVCVWYTKLLVVVHVLEACVQSIKGGSKDKYILVPVSLVYAIYT
jgi:hypothetical protein